MSRIAATFENLKQNNRKALIPFITAGDPDQAMTILLMHELVNVGADIIELGVPFSDPMADGPTIQRSYERALKHNISLENVLEIEQRALMKQIYLISMQNMAMLLVKIQQWTISILYR